MLAERRRKRGSSSSRSRSSSYDTTIGSKEVTAATVLLACCIEEVDTYIPLLSYITNLFLVLFNYIHKEATTVVSNW
jgi:hypothetical protein